MGTITQRSRSSPAGSARQRWANCCNPVGIGEILKRQTCPVVLEASHISVLEFVDLEALKAHAVKE